MDVGDNAHKRKNGDEMDVERRWIIGTNDRSYTILALLLLLLVDLGGEALPVPVWALICAVAVLSAVVAVGFVRNRSYLYLLLFGAVLLGLITDFPGVPGWTNAVANAAWIVLAPWIIWTAVKEWREDGGAGPS